MKVLSGIFVFFGILFVLMGLYVEPMFPAFCMALLFFAIAVLFWRNSKDEPFYVGDKEPPSETFRKNKERMEQIRKLRKEKYGN
jgi:flagellar biosynthesis component FlhA